MHVEIEWLGPCLDRSTTDADRDVTLEYDLLFACIIAGSKKLCVKYELDIAVEVYFGLVLLACCK